MFFSVVVRVSSSPKQLGKDFGNSSASSLNVHLMPSSIAGDASYFKCLFRKALGPPIHQPPQSPSSPEPSGKETKSGSDGDKSLQQLCQQQRTVRKITVMNQVMMFSF
ncbi:uncharacterized protein [Pocillopora verrucosa]|uniref:uncharacterized protein isoform X5 n=1 Tax=Pocillopora verrucosa TaxID=203993 RepID=UPI00333FE594